MLRAAATDGAGLCARIHLFQGVAILPRSRAVVGVGTHRKPNWARIEWPADHTTRDQSEPIAIYSLHSCMRMSLLSVNLFFRRPEKSTSPIR